jgi:hypothetical protein
VNQGLTRAEKYDPIRRELLLDAFNHPTLGFGPEVDQNVAQEDHIEELGGEFEGVLDKIQSSILDSSTDVRIEFIVAIAVKEMAIESGWGDSTDCPGPEYAASGLGECRLIDVGREYAPFPIPDDRVICEYDCQGGGLFPASAARAPDPETPVRPTSSYFSEDRINKRFELRLRSKEIGLFDGDLAEEVPPFL